MNPLDELYEILQREYGDIWVLTDKNKHVKKIIIDLNQYQHVVIDWLPNDNSFPIGIQVNLNHYFEEIGVPFDDPVYLVKYKDDGKKGFASEPIILNDLYQPGVWETVLIGSLWLDVASEEHHPDLTDYKKNELLKDLKPLFAEVCKRVKKFTSINSIEFILDLEEEP